MIVDILEVQKKCICSGGQFHYSNCPQYTEGCNDSFAKLGTAMSSGYNPHLTEEQRQR